MQKKAPRMTTKDIKKKAKSRKSKNAIKKNASKSRKCDKISTQNTGKVDTEFYEVQDIVRSVCFL